MADNTDPSKGMYPFTGDFQLSAMRRLLSDPLLLSRVAVHTKPERFANETVKLVLGEVVAHYKEHGEKANGVVVLQRLQFKVDEGKLTNDKVMEAALLMERADEMEPASSDYVQEVILAEARKAAMWDSLDQGLRNFRTGNYERIAELVDGAVRIGKVDASPGMDFGKGLRERTRRRKMGVTAPRLGTGIGALDDVIRGGLAAGALGTIIGAPKFGKSMALNTFAHHCLVHGGVVYYFSLEMGEQDLADRADAAMSGVPIEHLHKRADFVNETVEKDLADSGGQMIIKQFPSYKTTPADLEAHMQMLKLEHGLEPSLLIVDSADFCGASRASKEGRYEDLGLVYSELRGIGVTWDIPVWTATWANRDSLSQKVVTMEGIAESFKKAGIADLGIAICGTEEERQSGLVRLYTAFCRFTQSGVILGPYHNNFEVGLLVKGHVEADREDDGSST